MDYFARLPVLFSAKKQADFVVMRSRDGDYWLCVLLQQSITVLRVVQPHPFSCVGTKDWWMLEWLLTPLKNTCCQLLLATQLKFFNAHSSSYLDPTNIFTSKTQNIQYFIDWPKKIYNFNQKAQNIEKTYFYNISIYLLALHNNSKGAKLSSRIEFWIETLFPAWVQIWSR